VQQSRKPSTTSSCSTCSDSHNHPTPTQTPTENAPKPLAHITGDPIAGIALYVGKYYAGDACAAYMHQVEHGFY
jgi:hypothetical protein